MVAGRIDWLSCGDQVEEGVGLLIEEVWALAGMSVGTGRPDARYGNPWRPVALRL